MTSSLPLLFEKIHQIEDEQALRSQLSPQIGQYFSAKRSGIFFFDQLLADTTFQPLIKAALSLENPVVRYLSEHHAPVHEGLVTSPKAWAIICPRADHWHVLAGPIVSGGQLVGAVGCTREQSMPAFDTQDLADLSGICLHLSVWVATVRFPWKASPSQDMSQAQSTANSTYQSIVPRESPRLTVKSQRLTSRELQIAELVGLGRTNAEIGSELWITENSVKQALKRMFRKLDVSSRAQMVAQLHVISRS
jgi:DNA-binding CsgD family transcriptional regulator